MASVQSAQQIPFVRYKRTINSLRTPLIIFLFCLSLSLSRLIRQQNNSHENLEKKAIYEGTSITRDVFVIKIFTT